jgi:hypothetical protein
MRYLVILEKLCCFLLRIEKKGIHARTWVKKRTTNPRVPPTPY